MLSERQLEALLALFEERMQDVTAEYLTAMGEHLKAIGRLTPGDVHRLTEMKRVGLNARRIQREIARAANISVADLDRVFRATAESDVRFTQQWFAEDYTPAVKGLPKLSKPIERVLKAQLRLSAQAFKNLSQTTIETQRYRDAVDVAITSVQAGVTDYNSAIRRTMKAAAQDGLRVKYPNSGLTRRLDSAVRQNVLDGVRAVNNDVLRQLGNEYGADGVEISAHALCAADHRPYQGLQFSNREFEELQNSLDRPFGMWNCKHTVFPIILGVSVPAHDADELRMYRENSNAEIEIDGRKMTRYEWTQEQRRIETAVRAQKDIAIAARASGDDFARREAQARINALQDHYNRISKAAGLDAQRARMSVSGFRAVKTVEQLKGTPRYAILKTQQNREWLKRGYDRAVERGELSALTGFDHYMKVAENIERTFVGSKASDGVEIKGYVTHFLDRTIGSYEQQREGVEIKDILDAIANPQEIRNTQRAAGVGRQYITEVCKVVVNPETGMLIQVTPKKKGGA